MQESENKTIDHVVVTAPDRFYQESIVILFVDWKADLLSKAINQLQNSPVRLSIHIFDYNDNNYSWLIDVANQADIVAMDLNDINHIDLWKGWLITKQNSFYFGRMDINKIFLNYTKDPIGELLVRLGNVISQMEEK